jgi:NADH-quinone oxidoreductase subunit C
MTDVVSTEVTPEPVLSPLEALGQAIVANSAGAITAWPWRSAS